MENALVAFGASLERICASREAGPSIKTANGQLVFDASDHTFIRRKRETVSLFDVYDQVKTQGDKLVKAASDRAADLAAQATVVNDVSNLTTTVAGLTFRVDALIESTKSKGAEVPCTPGIEYQSGKDKAGNAICKYLTQPCNTFSRTPMFEKAAATRGSDRVCAPYTATPAGQFMLVAGGAFKDHVFKKHTVCTKDKQFETVKPTPTSDRKCQAVTDCKKIGKVPYKAATATSDAECATLGQVKTSPARDCVQIKQTYSQMKSDFFWIKGNSGRVLQVWCDLQHNGGGWMLVGHGQAADKPGCWGGTGDCDMSYASRRDQFQKNTWKLSDAWINHFTYYTIRIQGTGNRKGESYYMGKNVGGGCTYNHNREASGVCKRSYKTVSAKLGGAPQFGSGCQGNAHGCHRGVGDWPCYGGEVTTNHCHGGGGSRGWYYQPASCGGAQACGGCNPNMGGCTIDFWIR